MQSRQFLRSGLSFGQFEMRAAALIGVNSKLWIYKSTKMNSDFIQQFDSFSRIVFNLHDLAARAFPK